jgi:hypothetical protein
VVANWSEITNSTANNWSLNEVNADVITFLLLLVASAGRMTGGMSELN